MKIAHLFGPLLAAAAALTPATSWSQSKVSDGMIRIGVLTDLSG
jgi:hypothetical protein